jgi:hypothetical protein
MFGVKCTRGEGLDKEEKEGGQRRSLGEVGGRQLALLSLSEWPSW